MKPRGKLVRAKAEKDLARLWSKRTGTPLNELTEIDVLSFALQLVPKRRDTMRLAHILLRTFGGYARVLSAPTSKLLEVDGITEECVAALKTICLAAQYLVRSDFINRPVLPTSDHLIEYMLAALSREPREQFRALFLDSKNRVLHEEILSIGTVNHVSVYPREVISYALSVHASAIVLVHNHPTGDPKPSEVDVALTLQLQEMCEDLNIKLHDHIIVGDGRVFSFLKQGGLTHNRDRNNRRAYLVANEHDPEPSATS